MAASSLLGRGRGRAPRRTIGPHWYRRRCARAGRAARARRREAARRASRSGFASVGHRLSRRSSTRRCLRAAVGCSSAAIGVSVVVNLGRRPSARVVRSVVVVGTWSSAGGSVVVRHRRPLGSWASVRAQSVSRPFGADALRSPDPVRAADRDARCDARRRHREDRHSARTGCRHPSIGTGVVVRSDVGDQCTNDTSSYTSFVRLKDARRLGDVLAPGHRGELNIAAHRRSRGSPRARPTEAATAALPSAASDRGGRRPTPPCGPWIVPLLAAA